MTKTMAAHSDHLIGAGDQGRRHVEPDYLLEMVDHQLDLGEPVHLLVSRLSPMTIRPA
jgi:hypothetical protein